MKHTSTSSGELEGAAPLRAVPDAFQADTGLADSLAWVAECAAQFSEGCIDLSSDRPGEVADLVVSIRDAASAGSLDPRYALDAVAMALQAILGTAHGALNDFFRQFVGTELVALIRADSPLRAVWTNNVVYPEFQSSHEVADEKSDEEIVSVPPEATHRLGSMIHNLRCETELVVREDGGIEGADRWTTDAALSALLSDFVDVEISGQDVALLAAMLIVVIAEIFEWMDNTVVPGLSSHVREFLLTDVVRNMTFRAGSQNGEAA